LDVKRQPVDAVAETHELSSNWRRTKQELVGNVRMSFDGVCWDVKAAIRRCHMTRGRTDKENRKKRVGSFESKVQPCDYHHRRHHRHLFFYSISNSHDIKEGTRGC